MFGNLSVLGVIPARGGSKGVPLKNIKPLGGVPLIAHIIPVLDALPFFDRVVVSTDSQDIAGVARAYRLDVPFMRPEHLSGDTVGDVPVLQHALLEMERLDGRQFQIVVMLQPTCPLRRPEHVERTVAALAEGHWDAAWTVSRSDLKFHPLKQLRIVGSQLLYYDSGGSSITARQQLEQLYFRNGAAYAMSRQCVLEEGRLLGARTAGVLVDDVLVNIDTLADFDTAERLLSSERVTYRGQE